MNDTLTIGLTGDVMLGRTLDMIIANKGYDYPWGNLLPVMKGTDMNIINLETALTHSNSRVYKTFNFKASPDKVRSLTHANVTVANLANNHILDFAQEGLLETIDTLDAAGIRHVGAGRDLAQARLPVIIRRKDIRVGVLGITDNEPGWKAGSGPGTNYLNVGNKEEHAILLHAIAKLRKKVDIVIVSIHWGPNMRVKPTQKFVHLAYRMAQQGAHIIHGHSAHIVQGIGQYNNSLILYDTGDFVDDYMIDPYLRNDLAAYYKVTVNKSGLLSLQVLPTRIYAYQVNKAKPEDHDRVIRRIRRLSLPFNTRISEDGRIVLGSPLF